MVKFYISAEIKRVTIHFTGGMSHRNILEGDNPLNAQNVINGGQNCS